jgi:hypothetical protein
MPTQRYAANTTVDSGKSKNEIEKLVARYGANQFMSGWSEGEAVIGFRMHERFVRMKLPLPSLAECRRTPRGRPRKGKAAELAQEQEIRRRWRALALVVKAKLEAIASGVATFEQEFSMHVVMPDGRTVAEIVVPQIAEAYATGAVPKMLGA